MDEMRKTMTEGEQPRILINASNLHVGGGVQVAASFISEMANLHYKGNNIKIAASQEVTSNLNQTAANFFEKTSGRILDTFGFDFFVGALKGKFNAFDVVFTLFGPLYRWRPPFLSIVGFAQAWIIYPENEAYDRLTPLRKIATRMKFWVQAEFFKRADFLVVELDHVKVELVRKLGIAAERIFIVKNCISNVFLEPAQWEELYIPDVGDVLRLGFVGRNYSHKNTSIFPEIVCRLKNEFGISAKIFVTFTDAEWELCDPEFKQSCVNVGPLTVSQCPSFYSKIDAVIFPSLLECFSVTPLEAMAMERPLFASDRPFNRDICGDHAQYFDPNSPASAAEEIARVFKGSGPCPDKIKSAREHALSFSSPSERATAYTAILNECQNFVDQRRKWKSG